jgi:8-oxo-dGTP diphosphatase
VCSSDLLIINKLSKEDQPGLFVRRHNGIEMTDQEIIDKYIEKLNKVGGESPAYYNVGLAIIDEKGKLHTKLFKPKRYFVNRASPVVQKGIPLSSLAYDKKSKKYLSEMTFEERNKYEGKAFQQQAQFIKDIFRNTFTI